MNPSDGSNQIGGTSIIFGRPDRWEHFSNAYQLFFERFRHLQEVDEIAFSREYTGSAPCAVKVTCRNVETPSGRQVPDEPWVRSIIDHALR